MLSDMARGVLEKNEMGVFTTFRRDGGAQMSVVTCGLYGNGMAFGAERHRAKVLNVKRNPKCSLLISQRDWWGYVVLEGRAELIDDENTDAEELRVALRDVYRSAAHKEHPNWQEFDEVMKAERRAVVIVVPERVYGSAL